jgi:hypothetical protein
MAFQGNLRDFSVTEVLQLLGTQKKTGCLMLEWNEERALFYVTDGRMVSTRQPGMAKDDPLLRFLLKVHRLSNEQYRGILTIQRESNRDLEDLLVNGRYLEAEELSQHIERQIIEDLMRVMTWENGGYHFDANNRWPNTPLARLSVEGTLIEVARRMDEQKRFAAVLKDPHQLLGVRDLPDADEHLSEEECELFGIIDGRHTLAEIVEAAPLSDYEAREALFRMLDAGWIEIVGRRDPGESTVVAAESPTAQAGAPGSIAAYSPSRQALVRQLVLAVVTLVVTGGLTFLTRGLHPAAPGPGGTDVFAASHERDLRFALSLFHRERGRYPARLEDLVADGWIEARLVREDRRLAQYRPGANGQEYALEYRHLK